MKRLALLASVAAFAVVPLVAPAPAGAAAPKLAVNTAYLTGLGRPWDIGFAPDGTMIFTEREGRVRARRLDGTLRTISAPADVQLGSEGGVLGLAVDPNFASNRYLYVCLTSNAGGAPDVRVRRFTVRGAYNGWTARTDIITGMPYSTGRHSGCRPRFGPDGYLYVGTGDAAIGTTPQSGSSLGGKVLRVTRDGTAAPGNDPPAGFDPRIYTYGHRNVQGIAFRPQNGRAYSVEHGTDRDDEINLLSPGKNMGWDPVPGYDESEPMTDFTKFPSAGWPRWKSGNPTIAPSGATFLSGPQWKDWDGFLAVAVLKNTHLRIMRVENNGSITTVQQRLTLGVRLRSVVQGPDGNLYIATDVGSPNGAIWRVRPY
jgi:glucose/arabinose dehydrogenase